MAKANEKAKPILAICRVCQTRIRFDERPEFFDIVTCTKCGEDFEVVSLSPIQLDWPFDFVDDGRWIDYNNDDLIDHRGRISHQSYRSMARSSSIQANLLRAIN